VPNTWAAYWTPTHGVSRGGAGATGAGALHAQSINQSINQSLLANAIAQVNKKKYGRLPEQETAQH